MFQELNLGDTFSSYHCKSKYQSEKVLDQLSRINIFIGSNNSGKSRLLRALFSTDDYSYLHTKISKTEFDIATKKFIDTVLNNLRNAGYSPDEKELIGASIKKALLHLIYWGMHNRPNPKRSGFDECVQKLRNIHQGLAISGNPGFGPLGNLIGWFEQNREFKQYRELVGSNLEPGETNIERYYIPILRSLKGLSPVEKIGINSFSDIYRSKTIEEYFGEKGSNLNIFTGLTLYEDVTRLLLGNSSDRNKVKRFEKFIETSFFEKEVNIVPHLDSRTLHVKIGDKEHAIHELGDGIQSIIILTYQLFMNQGKNVIFYFEEPETHLHPGYQRLFIETLLDERFKSFQYFMTTHSNHFLDITLDYDNISVYSFHRHTDEDEFDVENVTSVDDNVLKLIGARTSSVFLSNCTIWVEGITDRIYIRKFLEIIQNDKPITYREDYHFSFVEYAGNNITHWSFLDSEDPDHPNINVERLCSKLFLITDNDGAGLTKDGNPDPRKKKKHERHKKLEMRLKERYCLLDCREIENILKKDIIKKVVKKNEPKPENLDFKKFDKNNHEKIQLGKFIDDNVVGRERNYTYKGSDALNGKLEFAKSAVEHIKTIADLSKEAKELAERLYKFIGDNN